MSASNHPSASEELEFKGFPVKAANDITPTITAPAKPSFDHEAIYSDGILFYGMHSVLRRRAPALLDEILKKNGLKEFTPENAQLLINDIHNRIEEIMIVLTEGQADDPEVNYAIAYLSVLFGSKKTDDGDPTPSSRSPLTAPRPLTLTSILGLPENGRRHPTNKK